MAQRCPNVSVRGPRCITRPQLTDNYASCLRCRALVRRVLHQRHFPGNALVNAYPDSQGIYTLHSLTCTAPRRRRSSLAPAVDTMG